MIDDFERLGPFDEYAKSIVFSMWELGSGLIPSKDRFEACQRFSGSVPRKEVCDEPLSYQLRRLVARGRWVAKGLTNSSHQVCLTDTHDWCQRGRSKGAVGAENKWCCISHSDRFGGWRGLDHCATPECPRPDEEHNDGRKNTTSDVDPLIDTRLGISHQIRPRNLFVFFSIQDCSPLW